jgi:hypothetical protein
MTFRHGAKKTKKREPQWAKGNGRGGKSGGAVITGVGREVGGGAGVRGSE